MDATLTAASALPTYAAAWLSDGTISVAVTGDAEAAEAQLRTTWGGPLCVTTVERTDADLNTINQELQAALGDRLLTSGSTAPDSLDAQVVFDDGSIQTPPLGGTILHGVSRDSLLTLARDMGLTVREERYSIEQWRADAESGHLTEAFACGTAAVVTPIGRVKGAEGEFAIGGQSTGPLTQRLRSALVDIQRGDAPDPYGWTELV